MASFTETTWVSWYQKNKIILDFNETRNGGVWGWQWHWLEHVQTVCTVVGFD